MKHHETLKIQLIEKRKKKKTSKNNLPFFGLQNGASFPERSELRYSQKTSKNVDSPPTIWLLYKGYPVASIKR